MKFWINFFVKKSEVRALYNYYDYLYSVTIHGLQNQLYQMSHKELGDFEFPRGIESSNEFQEYYMLKIRGLSRYLYDIDNKIITEDRKLKKVFIWNEKKLKKFKREQDSIRMKIDSLLRQNKNLLLSLKPKKVYKRIFSAIDPYGEENWES